MLLYNVLLQVSDNFVEMIPKEIDSLLKNKILFV